MSKLLRANFARLIKSKSLWLCVAAMLLFNIVYSLSEYRNSTLYQYEYNTSSDTVFFLPYIVVGILVAIFCSLYIGKEYSDGTIRNKMVVGHSRNSIYFVNFATCAAAGLLMNLAYLIAACALGIPLLGPLETDIQTAILWLLAGLLLTIACAAIFSLLSMLNQNKALVAVISIVIAFTAIFLFAYLNGRMNEPEFMQGLSMTVNDAGQQVVQAGERVPNPHYLNDSQRKMYQFIMDFLPTTQAGQLASRNVPHAGLMLLYSGIIIVVTNAAGMFIFRRKDLK
ncbi:hypothetical protein SAMN02745823_01258 [Sporobacter termitidis DSM 10068]|uniref:ABC-2 family transporter protein n=1 Tax=Sporobacter termitidis DSM 10068 TaxID=1123282 RepID=A0A1M5WGK5_9FIRM|nr:ABC transporter permease subunit [Sporobacter termitidis]SHH86537.1 hypothetical protein SAMN02745823_01258 [Sporobacter termitidis DSM 10068]